MKHIFYFTVAAALVFCGCKKEVKTATGSIYGVVADKATSEPVKSAGVQLSPTGTKTITGSEGQYEFANLAAGDYTITVSKTGYADLVNYAIKVEADKTNKGDVQIEVLPPSLRVVDNNRQDIDSLDFGSAEDDITRGFNIFNDGIDPLEWEIIVTSDWITELSKTSGTLQPGKTQGIIVTIDRNKLSGARTTTLHVTSDNGSKQIMVKAVGKTAAAVNTLDVTNISATTVTFNGEILNTGVPPYTECGFVYSTSSMPTIVNTIAKITANAAYSVNVSGLTQEQTYYVRAYVINRIDTAYGMVKSFTTINPLDYYVELPSAGIAVQKYDISVSADWYTATSLCASSTAGGKSDWRLPSTGELKVLSQQQSTIGGFTNSSYWSSNPYNYPYYSEMYYYCYFSKNSANGDLDGTQGVVSLSARCVRSLP